ncbi:VENN motif pre-toxin domain-containing protein [Rouxiella aceris]|nr:VENN motif pre-toxin domain-containing protein [Rouxiella aceris]
MAYDSALSQQGANMGGSVRVGVNAVVNALQALAGGDIKAALAQGAAPYLAAKVKEMTTGNADYSTLTEAQKLNNLMAHAILGGVIAELSGGNAASGATGAMTGELAAPAIALAFYGTADSDKLTSAEKENVSALTTLASGIAGGMVSDSASGAVTGAQAGKNAVENNYLSGDQARETVKQVAESLKNQVRDKLGEGTTSSIANGIINALAESGDSALGGADYAADAVMVLATCAAGDSYCSKAMSDLSGKNQVVADSVAALMKSETWSAVKDTVVLASTANQAALEATGGMLAGIILPGKKVPGITAAQTIANSVVDAKKFDYLFGKATGNSHTLDRTNQLALEMKRLGVADDINGHAVLAEHFTQATKNQNNIVKKIYRSIW